MNKAIIEGEVVSYTACHKERNVSIYNHMIYLGQGFIHEVNGTIINGKQLYHFWIKTQD